MLTHGLPRGGAALALLCSLVVVLCLGGYLSAQWLAGQKFLAGAFGASNLAALASFALLIVIYTSIGGFRGSVYVDSMQAVIRLIGTTLALAAVIVFANQRPEQVQAEWGLAGADYLNLMGQGGIGGAAEIIVGFAAAALGFGLGQPQLVSRYLAGSDAKETRAAWWIYIGFVQFTWAAMTLFGIYLRGVMPGLADPETGLSAFFEAHVHPVLTGIIIADIFATIAATSNALLVAMGQAVAHDLGARLSGRAWPLGLTCVLMGLATMGVSLVSTESVVSMALTSVSLLGAGLAPAMMAKVLGWRHTGASLIVAVLAGLAAAIAWRLWGASNLLNEAAIGIPVGVAANFLAASLASGAGASRVAKPPGHS